MRESLGVVKPKGEMKVKTAVLWLLTEDVWFLASQGDDQTALRGRFICLCQRGAPIVHTLGPERW